MVTWFLMMEVLWSSTKSTKDLIIVLPELELEIKKET
jgi:hypothetical protein